jgi:hypothetical protein
LDAFEKWLGQSKLGERHVKGGQSGRDEGLSISVRLLAADSGQRETAPDFSGAVCELVQLFN